MGAFAKSVCSAVCTISIAHGVLLWLGSKGIHPDQWVNKMIGVAEGAVIANPAGTWILLGLAGLLGLAFGPRIYDWGKSKLPKKAKEQAAESPPIGNGDSAPTRGTSKRDVFVLDAMYRVASGHWDKDYPDITEDASVISNLERGRKAILQAAADGDLPIWGKTSQSGVFEAIPADEWRHIYIDLLDVMRYGNSPENLRTKGRDPGVRNSYLHLMTTKEIVDELWQ